MSWTLGIDTSTGELGLGLYCGLQPVCGYSRYIVNSHAEHITQSIGQMLQGAGITSSDIGRLGIAVGPGSFTGLRIGVAFMKGFFFERQVRVLPISSLESLAAACPAANGPVVVAFDARREDVYWARFSAGEGVPARVTQDALSNVQDFMASIDAHDTVVTDTLGYARSTVFDGLSGRAGHFGVERLPVQRGLACARLASVRHEDDAAWIPVAEVTPQYMRASSPEEKLRHTPPR